MRVDRVCLPQDTADTSIGLLVEGLKKYIGDQSFHIWFKPPSEIQIDHGSIKVCLPEGFIFEHVQHRFRKAIAQVAQKLFDEHQHVCLVEIGENGQETGKKFSLCGDAARSTLPFEDHGKALLDKVKNLKRLQYRLDSFRLGPNSKVAYDAVQQVLQHPGVIHSPLCICAQSGLGKTHLLQGLCAEFIGLHPRSSWIYLNAAEFTERFLDEFRNNRLDHFRRAMRGNNLLVIDDLVFFRNKKRTQEELLYTMNALTAATGQQVVLSSEIHPCSGDWLIKPLQEQIMLGSLVQIDPPNFETRCLNLQALSKAAGIELCPETVQWIAGRVTQNFRNLKGAITRIVAETRLLGGTPDLSMAQRVFSDLDVKMIKPPPFDLILEVVARHFDVEVSDLKSGKRHQTISLARSMAIYLTRTLIGNSYPEITRQFCNGNHSTIISCCRRITRAFEQNEVLEWSTLLGRHAVSAKELVDRIRESVQAEASISS